MEKKEARIKCNGCGTSYKLKIPVTDKPVSFKCKKCGKILKLKVKAASGSPPSDPSMEFETSQLPDSDRYEDKAPSSPDLESLLGGYEFSQSSAPSTAEKDADRQWLVLAEDLIKGPYTKSEVVQMIQSGDIAPETSIRMGERPWLKAVELPDFREFFTTSRSQPQAAALETISLLDSKETDDTVREPSGAPFLKEFSTVLTYPVSGGLPIPLGIFAGIVFVFSTIFSRNPLIGLPLNIAAWMVLYGYLSQLMGQTVSSPDAPPPQWNFADVKHMVVEGARNFVVLLVYTIVPSGLALLVMTYFFVNRSLTIGYLMFVVTILIFVGSLFAVPAGLVTLLASGNIAAALNPKRLLAVITGGGRPYLTLAVISIAMGLPCLFVTLLGLYVSELIPVGFVVSGLLMAVAISYAHFIWFHVMGRFAGENRKVVGLA